MRPQTPVFVIYSTSSFIWFKKNFRKKKKQNCRSYFKVPYTLYTFLARKYIVARIEFLFLKLKSGTKWATLLRHQSLASKFRPLMDQSLQTLSLPPPRIKQMKKSKIKIKDIYCKTLLNSFPGVPSAV